MALSTALSPYHSASSSSHHRSKIRDSQEECSLWLNGKRKRLALIAFPRRSHPPWSVKSLLDNRKSRMSDNGASDPSRTLLERLYAQTQKLEEMGTDPSLFNDAQSGINLRILESDLQAALASLKKKEDDLQDAESKVLLERTELNCAQEELVHRENEIAAACSEHMKLEEELKLANLNLASQATQIEDLKLQIKQRVDEISTTQYALSFKEDEINKLERELVKKSEEAVNTGVELKSKAHLLDGANRVVKKQEVEIQQLREKIQEKEEELQVSASLQKLDEKKLEVAEANLGKQTMAWLLAQEELKKLAEVASKHSEEAIETMEDFGRVNKLLANVRSELVSSQKALESSRTKMEDQEQLLQKQLIELEELKRSVISHMKSLKDAQIHVESKSVKLRVAEARNKELERDLSMEKERIEQLQGELCNERASLEQAIQEKSFRQETLDRERTKFGEMHNLLQVKELELVEARLEVQRLKSELASLQLILDERSLELSNAGKKLKEVNEEIFEFKSLKNSREDQFMQATSMLKEKEEHMQSVQNDLFDTEKKFSEAESVVERLVELTNKLVVSVKDKEYEGLHLDNEKETKSLGPLSKKPSGDFKWGKKQLETELEFTGESLRTKEMEILAAERAVIVKDEELKMVQGRLDARERELKKLKEEMVQDANELRQLYALAQERIGERTMGDLAIDKLELGAAELEVEAATSALQKLAEMSRELLGKASLSFELDSDSEVFAHNKDGDLGVNVANSECIGELMTKVAGLCALTDRLVKEADIVVDVN
ncbi:hypothetical protein C3L33_07822, partial [Rhododendron williamsianum]